MLNDPIRRDCPTCNAHAGERCTDLEGHLMDYFHYTREPWQDEAARSIVASISGEDAP